MGPVVQLHLYNRVDDIISGHGNMILERLRMSLSSTLRSCLLVHAQPLTMEHTLRGIEKVVTDEINTMIDQDPVAE